ncbi:hypothetical protein PHYBLDRAFT_161163 [Phycomyces blakesleeanus NRRL 1555(-)]|uniref:Uncharacterized protein n=1 Tax=Phycomyces blakesleeanus (strain ATCC 8743b / DSM 1359 / FGSC 10004 / NBRC 33097 / NRRL 1555) TaxID=763407 RepID=A0A167QZI3_PHYB8|nr:hypothetical protein PHYBLDRAFT_161163 [Phycomyces blakesleeanus NRRL 1555(-)]OAD80517.1 hypothetical protein PHYBLDRAFT_161163 [Phycomyces blakesleeanus NRRL 1555(-)]|eukprot:XP_018298557.1 hypothetical protein PHYBLDRAFT_161163 [Phycomyces blakesleeanus NRRL 1555(-)]
MHHEHAFRSFSLAQIPLVVYTSLSAVKYIIKRVGETGSLQQRRGSERARKLDDGIEIHLMNVVPKDNFALYSRLKTSLKKIEVFVRKIKAIISYLKRLGFGLCIAAHKLVKGNDGEAGAIKSCEKVQRKYHYENQVKDVLNTNAKEEEVLVCKQFLLGLEIYDLTKNIKNNV